MLGRIRVGTTGSQRAPNPAVYQKWLKRAQSALVPIPLRPIQTSLGPDPKKISGSKLKESRGHIRQEVALPVPRRYGGGYRGEVQGGIRGGYGGGVRGGDGGDLFRFYLRADVDPQRPPGGRSMAVPTTLHIGRPCMQCTPGRIRGPGGQACRRAAGWVRREVGGGKHAHPAWGGGEAGRGEGGRREGGGGLGGAQGGGQVPSPRALGAPGGGQVLRPCALGTGRRAGSLTCALWAQRRGLVPRPCAPSAQGGGQVPLPCVL